MAPRTRFGKCCFCNKDVLKKDLKEHEAVCESNPWRNSSGGRQKRRRTAVEAPRDHVTATPVSAAIPQEQADASSGHSKTFARANSDDDYFPDMDDMFDNMSITGPQHAPTSSMDLDQPVQTGEDGYPPEDNNSEEEEEEEDIDESISPPMNTISILDESIECHVPEPQEFDKQLELSIELYNIVQQKGITDATYASILSFVNKCLATPELGK